MSLDKNEKGMNCPKKLDDFVGTSWTKVNVLPLFHKQIPAKSLT